MYVHHGHIRHVTAHCVTSLGPLEPCCLLWYFQGAVVRVYFQGTLHSVQQQALGNR